MPKVLSYTPSWLSRPSPGFDLFQPSPKSKSPSLVNGSKKDKHTGPCRTIAHRGTEVFVLAGNEIRWSDLVLLKDTSEELSKSRRKLNGKGKHSKSRSEGEDPVEDEGSAESAYRTLKVPVAGQIRQLIISPRGEYLAILTTHTAHVAILPDSSHLSARDSGPIRVKTFQLGPTAHVLEQAPLASALWHPLGHNGACLITLTTDATVRMWELNRENRHSFDGPALAVDLKKLANATSANEDFGASKYGTNKGFSPDSFEMEVAAACFGGLGREDEHGWAPMTLWIAMKEGDVYALCPLLPSKWQPPPSLIPSLSTAVVAKAAAIGSASAALEEERQVSEQQYKWFTEIDNQEPLLAPGDTEFDSVEVYARPSHPGPIPKLQGPFQLELDLDDDFEITDVMAIGAKLDDDELMLGEDFGSDTDGEGLSVGVICLLTNTGKVHICLDLDGVEGQWLPARNSRAWYSSGLESPSLLVFETISLSPATESDISWPIFSPDPLSRYSLFVTHDTGVFALSVNPWIRRLEDELTADIDVGAAFRLDLFVSSAKTLVDNPIKLPREQNAPQTQPSSVSSCVALFDSDLGYFLLTVAASQPYAAILDAPSAYVKVESTPPRHHGQALIQHEPRTPYQPSHAFYAPSALPAFINIKTAPRHRRALNDEIRLSPNTLTLMTDAHRLLSAETHALGVAAADLFRRCERLQDEFRDQIRRAADVAARIDAVTGDDEEDDGGRGAHGEGVVGSARVMQRIDGVRARQAELVERHERLRRRVARIAGRPLSAEEKGWAAEVSALAAAVPLAPASSPLPPDDGDDMAEDAAEVQAQDGEDVTPPYARYEAVIALKSSLVAQAESLAAQDIEDGNGERGDGGADRAGEANGSRNGSVRVPPGFRKQKVAAVMQLLERETALVDATAERLGRLSMLGL
ncbi:hypothetical protein BJ546DRAFT_1064149 [Cryomyces antarcticus]